MPEEQPAPSYGNSVSEKLALELKALDTPSRSSGCILLVDDDSIIRLVISDILTDLGYQVLTAESGKDAIKVFRLKQNQIDLVLLDLMMPEMSGADCFYQLKAIDPEVQVVIASGLVADDNLDELERDGVLDHINKPYSRDDLSRMLARFIHN